MTEMGAQRRSVSAFVEAPSFFRHSEFGFAASPVCLLRNSPIGHTIRLIFRVAAFDS